MPELVKKLGVPPEKRTNYDCKLIANALLAFISSIAEFKDGLYNPSLCLAVSVSLFVISIHIYTVCLCTSLSLGLSLCARCEFDIYPIEICAGFMKSDAIAVARRAKLRTVDADEAVFLQGFPSASALFLSTQFRS